MTASSQGPLGNPSGNDGAGRLPSVTDGIADFFVDSVSGRISWFVALGGVDAEAHAENPNH